MVLSVSPFSKGRVGGPRKGGKEGATYEGEGIHAGSAGR
jgi:hypothetical protein